MRRMGHLVLTLRSGEAPAHVPCHVDCLLGAGRPASRLDDGPVDRALARHGGGARCVGVFHARRSLGRVGEHHVDFDDVEERLGLSRTFKVEIADPKKTHEVLEALGTLASVESVAVQSLATTSLAGPWPVGLESLRSVDAWEPHERIRALEARSLEPGDERITTAIVDTGIVIGHPEFQRKCLAGYDTVDIGMGAVSLELRLVGDSRGHDYNPRDEVGHGCHVAGVIGAQGWRIPPGVGGRTLLLPIRVLAAAVSGEGSRRLGVGALPDIDAGMKVAVDLGASVVNMSFGTPESSLDPGAPLPHARIVQYADHYGCTLIAATGNSGLRERYYPAALAEVIAVGSVDRDGRRSPFCTYGDHLALCAPGERVVSAGRRGYQVSTGTSFAAPFVSGAAALLLSRARRAGRRLDGAAVKRLLVRSAAPLGDAGYSPETGHGLLDAAAAIRLLDTELSAHLPTRGSQ